MTYLNHKKLLANALLGGLGGLISLGVSVLATPVLAQTPSATTAAIEHVPGPDGTWDFLTFDDQRRLVYLARSNGVTRLDLATKAITSFPLSVKTRIALPINGGMELLVTAGEAGAMIMNATTGAVRVASIPTGPKADAAFFEPIGGQVWVLDNAGGGIAVVDPKTGIIAKHIDVDGDLESAALDGRGLAYITVEDKREVAVFDVRTKTRVRSIPIADCDGPTGLALDTRSSRLVALCANGKALIVDARRGAVLGSVTLGLRPDVAIYNPRTRLVYAPTGGNASMSVIDPRALSVAEVIQTGPFARTGAIDPRTGTVFLPSGTFAPSSIAGERPHLVPGSFNFLLVQTQARR
jgi:DNA-binding beta-propeller fold protein YncE